VLARQKLYCLSCASSLFCSGYFWDRVSFFPWLAWTNILLFMLSIVAWMTGACHRAQFFYWDGGVSQTFCLDSSLTKIFSISASQEARITGTGQWHPAWASSFLCLSILSCIQACFAILVSKLALPYLLTKGLAHFSDQGVMQTGTTKVSLLSFFFLAETFWPGNYCRVKESHH
jgi:hypothetical protein